MSVWKEGGGVASLLVIQHTYPVPRPVSFGTPWGEISVSARVTLQLAQNFNQGVDGTR